MTSNEIEQNEIFQRCVTFLNSIGIDTTFKSFGQDSFLPGFLIENGKLFIDKEHLKYPGDILHEAGHIAVVSAKDRSKLTEKAIIKRKDREVEEIMAIAWSYAACLHLDIDPGYVFHEEGYRGGSDSIVESCRNKEYIGMHMLMSVGMMQGEDQSGSKPFPQMKRWLRS